MLAAESGRHHDRSTRRRPPAMPMHHYHAEGNAVVVDLARARVLGFRVTGGGGAPAQDPGGGGGRPPSGVHPDKPIGGGGSAPEQPTGPRPRSGSNGSNDAKSGPNAGKQHTGKRAGYDNRIRELLEEVRSAADHGNGGKADKPDRHSGTHRDDKPDGPTKGSKPARSEDDRRPHEQPSSWRWPEPLPSKSATQPTPSGSVGGSAQDVSDAIDRAFGDSSSTDKRDRH